jgi:hypothetical protein
LPFFSAFSSFTASFFYLHITFKIIFTILSS